MSFNHSMNPLAPEKQLQTAETFIRSNVSEIPPTAIVLGSGLGYFADNLAEKTILNTVDIPHFPKPTVAGHAGKIIFGKIRDLPLIAVQGRSHYYEGRSLSEITFYVQLLARLGINHLILTNAAGSVNPTLKPGDLVLLNDYLNFTQIDILPTSQIPENCFSQPLAQTAKETARSSDISLHEGCYCWTSGPSYETHAEVQMIRDLGADVIGMSTVPEVIVGAYLKLQILGISLVTNLGAGIGAAPLTHEEVQTVAETIKKPYSNYIQQLIVAMNRGSS